MESTRKLLRKDNAMSSSECGEGMHVADAGRHLRMVLSIAGEESQGEDLEGPEIGLRSLDFILWALDVLLFKFYNHLKGLQKEKE